jgi:hypothetical protein
VINVNRLIYIGLNMGIPRAEAYHMTLGELISLWHYKRLFAGELKKEKSIDI